jgi:hypothetical protein
MISSTSTRRRGRALSMQRVGRLCCTTCCALRWPEERVEQRPDGLLRITLKKAYRDGTIAVEMDQAVAAVPARQANRPCFTYSPAAVGRGVAALRAVSSGSAVGFRSRRSHAPGDQEAAPCRTAAFRMTALARVWAMGPWLPGKAWSSFGGNKRAQVDCAPWELSHWGRSWCSRPFS